MSAALFLLLLGPLIQDIRYTYDTVANVTLIGDDINLGSACDSLENITYDALHRLKSYARDGQTTLFNYDEIGNITLNQEMGSAEYVYFGNTRPHAVWGANGRVYGYDEAGNMTLRNGQTLVYDEQNRLRQVDNVYYFYNDDGERVRKTHFGAETVWIDDLYEREPGRPLCHVQAGGKRIVTFSADGVEVYYYHSDHLGSSSLMTDGDGSLVRQQYGYRCFGSERFSLSFWPSFTSRFTGQPYDTETGLYYYQSRYYDAELGRFIQPDSIVPNPNSSQSLNRYSYVLNNPLKYIDPTGHAEQRTGWNQPFGSGSLGFGGARNWLVGGFGGSLGAGFGRDWLGLGWQAGGYGTMGLSSISDPYALWGALSDSPSGISGYDRASFLDKWNYQPARAFEDTLKTAASVSLMALAGSGPIASSAAAARVGATFPVTRMAPIAAKSGVWSLGPGPRGLAIEAQLGGNLPVGFPVIDRFHNGVATSIKSIDLAAASYQNAAKLTTTLDKYVDAVAGFNGAVRAGQEINAAQITARQLQLAIPPGGASAAQQGVINAAAARAKGRGVNLIVTPFP